MCGRRSVGIGLAVVAVALLSASPVFAQGRTYGGPRPGYSGHNGHYVVQGYPSPNWSYMQGYQQGYVNGYQNGLQTGYGYGYTNGYYTGFSTGYYTGYSSGVYGNGMSHGGPCRPNSGNWRGPDRGGHRW